MQDIIIFLQEHWLMSMALIAILILLILIEFIKQKRGGFMITPAQLTRLLNHENAVAVDLRQTDAFNNGHVISAISLPLAELEAKFKKIEPFKSQPIVLICAQGNDSARAADSLQKKGLKIYVMAGGMRAWKEADMPTVKENKNG